MYTSTSGPFAVAKKGVDLLAKWCTIHRLNADEQIQMVTALALELIQCVVKLPYQSDDQEEGSEVCFIHCTDCHLSCCLCCHV